MRIVWLKTELLHPVDRGGRIRTFNMLRSMRRRHDVTYVALDADDDQEAPDRSEEYAQRLVKLPHPVLKRRSATFAVAAAANLFAADAFSIARFRSPAMQAWLERLHPSSVDVVVCDFLYPAVNLPAILPWPVVLFQHNVEAIIWERHAATARDPLRRAYFSMQARRLRRFEDATCRRVDHVLTVSADDRLATAERAGISTVDDVPTGVDVEYFSLPAERAPIAKRLIFTGAMDWLPNEDGMAYFLAAVWPRVRARHGDATLTIVGRNPTAALRAAAAAAGGVELTGTVPDVRPHMASGSLFIVPLRIGGGTRLKIFEAMSMGLPVISTTIGAEGLPLRPGIDFIAADGREAMAAAIIHDLDHPDAAAHRGLAAATLVRANYSWDAATDRFTDLCAHAAERRSANRS